MKRKDIYHEKNGNVQFCFVNLALMVLKWKEMTDFSMVAHTLMPNETIQSNLSQFHWAFPDECHSHTTTKIWWLLDE